MKTLKANTQEELNKILENEIDFNINLTNWKDDDVDLIGAEIKGYVRLTNAKIKGSVYLRDAEIKEDVYLSNTEINSYVDLRGAEIKGDVDLRYAKIKGKIIQNYTQEDIDFLKSLPMDIIDLAVWQSNSNWLEAKSLEEIHTCGTTYCVRGYAEAQYYVENGKQVEDENSLYPNLKHLFFMSNEQFKKERLNIINK